MPKHKYMVMKRVPGEVNINTGRGRRRTWRENGGKADFFYVSSKEEAKEIDDTYGTKGTQEVWVKEHGMAGHDATYHPDKVHNYFFGSSSQRYRDEYDRIFRKKKRDGKTERVKMPKRK